MPKPHPKLANLGWLTLKLLVFAGTLYYLHSLILTEGHQPETWLLALQNSFTHGQWPCILGALFLLPVNWGLEAWKWQKLAGKVENITYKQAYQAVLAGQSLGFVTPNRLGDYAGRLLALQSRQRLEALGAIFLGRFCQLSVTLVTGTVGCLYFLISYVKPGYSVIVGVALLLALVNAVWGLLLFRTGWLLAALNWFSFLRPLGRYVKIMRDYPPTEICTLLQISGARYGVFLGQFILLLYAFGVQLPWYQLALAVSATFLIKSIMPSLSALTDVGTRELAAVYFFNLLGQSSAQVMSASLSLWFMNIGIPSMVGLIFIWQLKFKVKKRRYPVPVISNAFEKANKNW